MSGMTESTAAAVKHVVGPDAVKHVVAPDAVKHVVGPDAVKHVVGPDAVKHRYALAEAERMAQLSAEISDRLVEMGRIFTATTGQAPDGAALRFVPGPAHAASADEEGEVTYVEIICGPDGCGCYVTLSDGTGLFEYPCGG